MEFERERAILQKTCIFRLKFLKNEDKLKVILIFVKNHSTNIALFFIVNIIIIYCIM